MRAGPDAAGERDGSVLVTSVADDLVAELVETLAVSVVRVPPDTDVCEHVDSSQPACLVVGVGSTGAVELVESIRAAQPTLPILCLVDAAASEHVLATLEAGATDVVRLTGERTDGDVLGHRVTRILQDGAQADGRAGNLDATLETVISQVPVSLYLKDTEGRHLVMSEYDIDPARVIGKTDVEVYDQSHATETYADDMRVIETGAVIDNKEEYNPETGEWTLTSKVPWRRDDGEIKGLIGVTRFVTEKKEYERALKEQNERLEEFANVVSHDLRNPLNVAIGNLELAQEGREDALDRVADAHDRMNEIIDDLLTLARAGRSAADPEPVSLHGIARAAWATVDTADATLALGSDVSFDAHPGRVRQLLENLFANAVTHAGPDVTVTIEPLTDDSGFAVQDDGPGIPPDIADTVFDPGVTTQSDGTGFGLAIVADVADAHGWTVTLVEDTPGTRFEFAF
mgnify:CR=1 FL=1